MRVADPAIDVTVYAGRRRPAGSKTLKRGCTWRALSSQSHYLRSEQNLRVRREKEVMSEAPGGVTFKRVEKPRGGRLCG
jgi:hypothetical protein